MFFLLEDVLQLLFMNHFGDLSNWYVHQRNINYVFQHVYKHKSWILTYFNKPGRPSWHIVTYDPISWSDWKKLGSTSSRAVLARTPKKKWETVVPTDAHLIDKWQACCSFEISKWHEWVSCSIGLRKTPFEHGSSHWFHWFVLMFPVGAFVAYHFKTGRIHWLELLRTHLWHRFDPFDPNKQLHRPRDCWVLEIVI